jgi:hypothetical protein
MQIFAHNIDELVNAGFTWETDGELYDRIIQTYVDILNADNSIHAAVVSKEYELLLELYSCNAVFNIFQDENNRTIIISALSENTFGLVEVSLYGEIQEMYFQAIPLNNIEFWVLIGIDRNYIVSNLDLDKLRLPIFMIGVLFIISTMDGIWQRIVRIRRM